MTDERARIAPRNRTEAAAYVEQVARDGHACRYGHFGCAAWDRGPCSDEVALSFNLDDDSEWEASHDDL